MQPEQAGFLFQMNLAALRNERRITTAVIEAIPADRADYRPDQISKTAMELAWHIVSAELRFMDCVISGVFDTSAKPKPESIKTPSDLVAWYHQNSDERLAQMERLPDEQLVKIVDFRGRMRQPAVTFLNVMLHHSVHHRGQLSMYLRPVGAKVPAIYGESYDSAAARQAAQSA